MPGFFIIGISEPVFNVGKISCVNELLESGAIDYFHLRFPESSADVMRSAIKLILPDLRPRIKLHSFPDLALDYGCGVHHNKRCGAIVDNISSYSRSCHSLEEIELIDDGFYEYVTLSPIFDSISKYGYESTFKTSVPDITIIRERKRSLPNVIALGGVTPDSFSELRAKGFSGAAMLGYLWDYVEKYNSGKFIEFIKKAKYAAIHN